MIPIRFSALFGISLLIVACSDSTKPETPIGDTIQFHGSTFHPDQTEVSVRAIAGDPENFWLQILFRVSDGGLATFKVQDPDNDPDNLLALGEHNATGQYFDSAYSGLTDDRISMDFLESDQFSIVWQSILVSGQTFSGEGYISIKQRINYACVDSIQTVDGVFGPGDPIYDQYFELNCAPGFYFPEQKIRFACEESTIWWH